MTTTSWSVPDIRQCECQDKSAHKALSLWMKFFRRRAPGGFPALGFTHEGIRPVQPDRRMPCLPGAVPPSRGGAGWDIFRKVATPATGRARASAGNRRIPTAPVLWRGPVGVRRFSFFDSRVSRKSAVGADGRLTPSSACCAQRPGAGLSGSAPGTWLRTPIDSAHPKSWSTPDIRKPVPVCAPFATGSGAAAGARRRHLYSRRPGRTAQGVACVLLGVPVIRKDDDVIFPIPKLENMV